MKFLFDLFPVILFFVAFKLTDIYVATGVAIAATCAQIGWLAWRGKRIDAMLWVSLAVIVLFAGDARATERDLHQVEAHHSVLAVRSLTRGGARFRRTRFAHARQAGAARSGVTRLPGLGVSSCLWAKANCTWRSTSTDWWVNFKLFGGMGLMFAFVIAQAVFLARYMEEGSKQ